MSLAAMKKRQGRCYELAGRKMALPTSEDSDKVEELGEPVLVHGSVQPFGSNVFPRIAHAWIEYENGMIWEPISDSYIEMAMFIRTRTPAYEVVYLAEGVRMKISESKHWGPWKEPLYPTKQSKLCICGHIKIGSEVTEHRNLDLNCPEHGTESAWWKSPEQKAKRKADNARLRDLQRQATEAKRRAKQTKL